MNSRTKNSIINIIVLIVMQIMALFYSLISKRLFLDNFSLSIYGVIDLFNSFFNSLMMLELGFGTILVYNLYKPLTCGDIKEIRKQLSIFKTVYGIVSAIILIISIVAMPFLYCIFNIGYQDKILVYEIYILNIVNILIKYYFINKISIISASQTNYIQNISTIVVDFICFVFKTGSLLLFKNEYMYVASLLFVPSITYFMQTKWVNLHYDVKNIKYANFKTIKDSGVLSQMYKYIYATIYNLIFFSMDNIIISAKLSTDAVAYTSNYLILFNMGGSFTSMLAVSLRGIMADYKNTNNNMNGYFNVFKIVSSVSFIVVSIMITGFYTMINSFISLWIGAEYIITQSIVIVLILIRLIDSLCEPVSSVFMISGYIFKEKVSLIISAGINLILTLVLIEKYGLIGAYIATLIATIAKWIGKFYYVMTGIFYEYRHKVAYLYLKYIGIIIMESYLISLVINTFMPSIDVLTVFVEKVIIIIILVSVTNILIVLVDKDVRDYFKNTIYLSFYRLLKK